MFLITASSLFTFQTSRRNPSLSSVASATSSLPTVSPFPKKSFGLPGSPLHGFRLAWLSLFFWGDSLTIISRCLSFVKHFFELFSKSFLCFPFLPPLVSDLLSISPFPPFVNAFFREKLSVFYGNITVVLGWIAQKHLFTAKKWPKQQRQCLRLRKRKVYFVKSFSSAYTGTVENDFAKSKQRQGELDVLLAVFVFDYFSCLR